MPLILVPCHLLVQSTLDNSGKYYKSLLGCCIYVSLSERWVLYYHIYHTFSNRILAWLPEINPMGQVPAVVDGRFKLFERYPSYLFSVLVHASVLAGTLCSWLYLIPYYWSSCCWDFSSHIFDYLWFNFPCQNCSYILGGCSHAVLRYLACAFPNVGDHW